MRPSVGRIVHYVSYGTPSGEYTSECRAAIVTEVGTFVDEDRIGLAVLNPTGMFFNRRVDHDELPPPDKIVPGERDTYLPGTWHWPERVGES